MGWTHDPRYDSKEYRERRRQVLAGEPRCVLAYAGICTGRATETDHKFGLDADPNHKHLRAVCGPCHDVVTAAARRAALAGRPRNPDVEPTPATEWGAWWIDDEEEPKRRQGPGSGPRMGSV